MPSSALLLGFTVEQPSGTARANIQVTCSNESTSQSVIKNTASEGKVIFNLGATLDFSKGWAVGDIIGAVGFLIGNPMNNTGNIAHLSGMFFGFIFGMVYRRYFRQVRNVNVSIDEGEVRNWERSWMKYSS